MKSGNPQLVALMVAEPGKAHARIRAALRGRTIGAAAAELGITRRTLTRWLAQHPTLARECRKATKARTP